MNRFIQILDQISIIVERDVQKRYKRYAKDINFNDKLYYSIKAWCSYLQFSEEITSDIVKKSTSKAIEELSQSLYQESKTPTKRVKCLELPTIFYFENKLYQYIQSLFNYIFLRNDDMKIIVFIAFVIVAVGYFIYILNKPKQQEQTTRQPDYQPPSQDPSSRVSSPVSTVETPPAPVKPVVKNVLILVVSASQQSIVESIKTKGKIDYEDSETLYEATQFLRQDTESNLLPKLALLDQFQVVDASEFDIYLITIKLNQTDEGFNKNVNQTDRFYAFRNLATLAKTVTVSPRLQMEAYGNFNVYNR